jgi:hypothetical protein
MAWFEHDNSFAGNDLMVYVRRSGCDKNIFYFLDFVYFWSLMHQLQLKPPTSLKYITFEITQS